MNTQPLYRTEIEGYPVKRGKVRDVYDIDEDTLVIVTTDRISCFDYVLPTPIPEKGRVLTQISIFWMDQLGYENHLISDDVADLPSAFQKHAKVLEERTMLVRKCRVIPFECIVRGNLAGSGWAEYQQSGMVAGIELPPGLQQNSQFPRPVFTPSTKEESGHDVNITFREMQHRLSGKEARFRSQQGCEWGDLAEQVKQMSLDAFADAQDYAWHKGIVIADTKFEWGLFPDGELCLIDEVLTPDSSRFWPLDAYQLGKPMPSFDKQFVRDWLLQSGWDRNSTPPELPADVVEQTKHKYFEAYHRLTGNKFS